MQITTSPYPAASSPARRVAGRSRCCGAAMVLMLFAGVASSATARADAAELIMPAASLAGTYAASPTSAHPYVFSNRQRALALLAGAKTNPVEAMLLKRLEVAVQQFVQQTATFATPYTGCDIDTYTSRFSTWPTGAATIADRLALYDYLVSLNKGYGNAALAAQARVAAETIMLNWAESGFRISGAPITSYTSFCSSDRPPATTWAAVGFQVGRGMVNFTEAADFLVADQATPASWTTEIQAFLTRQLALVVGGANYHYSFNTMGCTRFDNQASMQILAMLTMARYLDDEDVIRSIAGAGSTTVSLSWPQQVEGTIYGTNDTVRSCYGASASNVGIYSQTAVAAPGEIVDRFRAAPYQPFGYTLGNLISLQVSATLLSDAGYSPFAFVGNKGQSLETALDYYSFYVKNFMSDQAVSIPTSGYNYPDFAQYAGIPFTRASGASLENMDAMLTPFLLGYQSYPSDTAISAVLVNDASLAAAAGVMPFEGLDVVPLAAW